MDAVDWSRRGGCQMSRDADIGDGLPARPGRLEVRGSAGGAAHQAPIRVAVAEDAYVIREFLSATLSSAPQMDLVAVCSDGNELLAAIKDNTPDVVLTDIRMPPSGAE